MELRICNYLSASFLLEREPRQWPVIAVLDSGKRATEFIENQAQSFLYLRFDDIEEDRPGKQPPTRSFVQQAFDFAHGKDKLLVSCRAGQGRSVALAYLIGCREHGATESLKLLDATRHRPNRLVVSIGDAILDSPGALAAFDAWRVANSSVRLAEHYADIEREFSALESQGARDRISEI